MKKIILVLVFQFIITGTNAQDKTTPTKQETMDWIAEKMKQYPFENARLKFDSYDGNGLLKYSFNNTDGYESWTLTKTLDLNLLTGRDGNKLIGKIGFYKTSQKGISKFFKELDLWELLNWTVYSDHDFQIRLHKAFDMLAKYNNQGSKPEKF